MRSPSVGAAAMVDGTDPAARITCRGRSVRGAAPATSTAPSPVRRAVPVTTSTPFFLRRPATPRRSDETTLSFRACIAATSTRAPSTKIP